MRLYSLFSISIWEQLLVASILSKKLRHMLWLRSFIFHIVSEEPLSVLFHFTLFSFSFYLHSLIQLWYILDSSLLLWRWMNELPNLLTLTYVFNQVIPLFDSEECGQVYTNEYIFDTVIFLIIKQLKWCLFSSGFDHGPNCVTKWMEWHKSLLNVFCTVLKKITMDKKVSNVSSGGSRIWP